MNNDKILHVYDLDDTLTATPNFADFFDIEDGATIDTFKYYPSYFKQVKSMFWDKLSKDISFKKSGDFVVIINKASGKPFDGSYINYFLGDRRAQKMFEVYEDVLTLRSFPGFHSTPDTIGKMLNQIIVDKYKSVENKMILTGRDEKLRKHIEDNLKELGMEYPNQGLKLYSGNSGIKNWKANTIIDSVKEHGWNEVHFYEDREDWLKFAEESVKKEFPNVKFVAHHVSNIKNARKF